jgi:hypothetical protein
MKYSRIFESDSSLDHKSKDAQELRAQGLLWAYAFFHEESVRCFQAAADLQPSALVRVTDILSRTVLLLILIQRVTTLRQCVTRLFFWGGTVSLGSSILSWAKLQ